MRMAEGKTLSPRTDGIDRPKFVTLGQLAGLRPSRPLWVWATVKPKGIVHFSILLELFKWSSNQIRFEFEFISNLLKLEY
jgi:hypothetical protein